MENLYINSAWLYDLDVRVSPKNEALSEDVLFYLEYAKQQQGEILELACGTGRVSIPLAEAGFHVTGLDLSEQMLGIFREKLVDRPELDIEIVHSNIADFKVDRKFALIIAPFRAFQCLTDDSDIANALTCVREHLTDDGIFIVNVFNPYPVMDESWCRPEMLIWERLDEETGNYVVKKVVHDKIDTENRVIYPYYVFEVTYPDGRAERILDYLKLKYYYSDQLRAEIEKTGMIVVEEYSWYDKSPPGGREIIFICKRKD
ncbi:MAG: class I SAM-dependent methyltransferase [Oscillospiraceae bacterium]|nr:class I SAM-dependent methyltransferase [Oscillospiraceae bacterium]